MLRNCNLLFIHFSISVDSSLLQNASFQNCSFSSGDFVEFRPLVEKRTTQSKLQQQVTPATETLPEEDPIEAQLCSCKWEGCMKTFQRHYNLEQHLLYGKCKIEEERYSLIDMAKLLHRKNLVSSHTRACCSYIKTGESHGGMGTEINKIRCSL